MRFPVLLHHPHRFSTRFCAFIFCLSIGFHSATPIFAQTVTNQTYSCGTYGAGSYQTNCVAGSGAESSPIGPASPTSSPTGGSRIPDTGATLRVFASIGAVLVALGAALYGRRRRQRPVS
ncbi:MAG: LPXTG cell wall anchor domain-containing protein [Thermomicrobiales bacterium]